MSNGSRDGVGNIGTDARSGGDGGAGLMDGDGGRTQTCLIGCNGNSGASRALGWASSDGNVGPSSLAIGDNGGKGASCETPALSFESGKYRSSNSERSDTNDRFVVGSQNFQPRKSSGYPMKIKGPCASQAWTACRAGHEHMHDNPKHIDVQDRACDQTKAHRAWLQ